jgi:hypothetical protein
MTFLSTSRKFAVRFVGKPRDGEIFLYMCKLKKPLNLFNIASKYDRQRMDEYLKLTKDTKDINLYYEMMSEGLAQMRRWNHMENDDFIRGYRELNFDGFTTTEQMKSNDHNIPYTENIAVFDPTNIMILRQYTNDDLKEGEMADED